MKKTILSTVICGILLFAFSFSVMGYTYYRDLSNDYYINNNPAYYYYTCRTGTLWGYCWDSTEISVPTDGEAYTYARIANGNLSNFEQSWDVQSDGYSKSPAVWLHNTVATETEHTANRRIGSLYTNINDVYKQS